MFGLLALTVSCSKGADEVRPAVSSAPADSQHAGITSPHGDHSPHRGGMVLMKDDLHFEVVLDRQGGHQVWFTDAVRNDLPASVASGVTMIVARPGETPETLTLVIDESGESWRATGRAVGGDDVLVTVAYLVEGAPYQIELPFFIPATP